MNLLLSINLSLQTWCCRWSKQAFILDSDRWDLSLIWPWDGQLRRNTQVFYTGGHFGCEKRWYYGLLLSRQLLENGAHQTLLIPASAVCERAVSLPRFLAFRWSPWQQERAWLGEVAHRQGEGTLPQTWTRKFTFLQPWPRLAKTLPRAIRYFLMNYISELKMKGLRVSQEHIAVGQQGNQRVFSVVRLFV